MRRSNALRLLEGFIDLDYPPAPVLTVQKLIGLFGVQNPSADRVVIDWPFDKRRRVDELHQLGQRTANFKAGKSLAVAFARLDPFPMMPDGNRKCLRWAGFDALKFLFGQQNETRIPRTIRVNRSLRAYQQVAPPATSLRDVILPIASYVADRFCVPLSFE